MHDSNMQLTHAGCRGKGKRSIELLCVQELDQVWCMASLFDIVC